MVDVATRLLSLDTVSGEPYSRTDRDISFFLKKVVSISKSPRSCCSNSGMT